MGALWSAYWLKLAQEYEKFGYKETALLAYRKAEEAYKEEQKHRGKK